MALAFMKALTSLQVRLWKRNIFYTYFFDLFVQLSSIWSMLETSILCPTNKQLNQIETQIGTLSKKLTVFNR